MAKFKVWIEQVNQTMIEVNAKDRDEAGEKAYRLWRRTDGHSRVSYIEKVEGGAES